MAKQRIRRTGTPRGRVPRDRTDAKCVVLTVRMPGELHARLNAHRQLHKLSMNQIALELLDQALPPAPAASSTPEAAA